MMNHNPPSSSRSLCPINKAAAKSDWIMKELIVCFAMLNFAQKLKKDI
jgi:hypothetical protein